MNTRLLAIGVAANLVTNGSFETGDFSGWTEGGNFEATGVTTAGFDGFAPEDGSYFAFLGPVGSDGTLSQTITDVAAATYLGSFYLASDGGTPNDFSASLNGVTKLSLTDIPQTGYVHYFGDFVGTGSDTITFSFRNDPSYLPWTMCR